MRCLRLVLRLHLGHDSLAGPVRLGVDDLLGLHEHEHGDGLEGLLGSAFADGRREEGFRRRDGLPQRFLEGEIGIELFQGPDIGLQLFQLVEAVAFRIQVNGFTNRGLREDLLVGNATPVRIPSKESSWTPPLLS